MNQDYPAGAPVARRQQHKWTDGDQAAAEALRESGLSYRAIAKVAGFSEACIRYHLCPEKSDNRKAKRRIYYQQNKEKCRAQEKAWRLRNLELDRANKRIWRLKNREKCRKYTNAYYARNAETERAKARAFYQENREAEKARKKASRDRNLEKRRAHELAWRERHRENCRISTRAWQQRNPDKQRHYNRQRRAIKRASHRISLAPLTLTEKIAIFASFGDCCVYCGKSEKLTVDHVLPLSRGGLDEASNIVPSCGNCNCRKRTAPVESWYRLQSFFTEERWLRIQEQCPHSVLGQIPLALPLYP